MDKKEIGNVFIITLLSGNGYTGVETHIRDIEALLIKNGASVTVITPYQSRLPLWRLGAFFQSTLGFFRKEIGLLAKRKIFYWILRSRLRSEVKRVRSGSINYISHDPLSASVVAGSRSAYLPGNSIVVSHFNISEADEYFNSGLINKNGRLWNDLMDEEYAAYTGSDHVVFVSSFMKKTVLRRFKYGEVTSFRVIHNFCSEPKSASDIVPGSGRDLISIGTLEDRKNQLFLLRVLAECRKQGEEYSLTIVGDGPDRGKLIKYIERLGLEDKVEMLGSQSQAARFIKGHRLLVHSALQENLPITLIEALASGTPIMASPCGGIPEIFEDGVEGRYWDINDVEASARLLIEVLSDRQMLREMSNQALTRHSARFTSSAALPQWLDLLSSV